MDAETALIVIRPLAEGVDPCSGEEYDAESPYQKPQIVRALATAVVALEHELLRDRRQKSQPPKAGTPWSNEENEQLLGSFDAGTPLRELARQHERSVSAIRARLEQFERLERR